MTSTQKKRLGAVVAVLVAAGAVAYLAFGNLESNLVFYWTPADLLAKASTTNVKDATIRLGGMVKKGSLQWDGATMRLRFIMGEGPEPGGPSVAVEASGVPPQLLREGIGCIVEGRFDGQVFHSDRLMVKHSNEYKPPQSGDAGASDVMPATHPKKPSRTGNTP